MWALVEEIEKEYNLAEHNQKIQALLPKTWLTQQKALAQPVLGGVELTHYPYGISPILLLSYYEKEYERIHYVYYTRQIAIHDRDYQERLDRMQRAIEIMRNDPEITDEEKQMQSRASQSQIQTAP